MEAQDLCVEGVGGRRCAGGVPIGPRISGVEECVGVGDEVGTVGSVFVMVKGKETLVWVEPSPGVSFVA